jgi:hypothetical protein
MTKPVDVFDCTLTFDGQPQPDPATIIWRFYFGVYKDSVKASEAANSYLQQLTGKSEMKFF